MGPYRKKNRTSFQDGSSFLALKANDLLIILVSPSTVLFRTPPQGCSWSNVCGFEADQCSQGKGKEWHPLLALEPRGGKAFLLEYGMEEGHGGG